MSVDDIADAARSNKMTLYRHFESKNALIAEYVRKLAVEQDCAWEGLTNRFRGEPLGALKAWIDLVAGSLSSDHYRGCPLANAAVEIAEIDHPARSIIEEHKQRQRDRLVPVCRDAGFVESERLADQIFLLIEGARVNVQATGRRGPGSRIRELLLALLASSKRTN